MLLLQYSYKSLAVFHGEMCDGTHERLVLYEYPFTGISLVADKHKTFNSLDPTANNLSCMNNIC